MSRIRGILAGVIIKICIFSCTGLQKTEPEQVISIPSTEEIRANIEKELAEKEVLSLGIENTVSISEDTGEDLGRPLYEDTGEFSGSSSGTKEPIVQGCLDKSIIRRVIDENMDKLRACYEKGLTTDPSLRGKIVVKFIIGPDGAVMKAQIQTSEMNSEMVESCLIERFEEMKFPTPKGSTVIVSYPFLFQPRAEEEEEKDEE